MSTTFKDDIERKLDTIWRFIVWGVAFLISLAICLPGIFISLQYSQDDCVKGSGTINIALDWWLFIACSFVLLYMILLVVFICANAKTKTFRIYWIIVHIIQLVWYSIGIYLIYNSTLKCQHNSLWQMSFAYCCIMGVAWIAETIWIVLKWCGCGCNVKCGQRQCCTQCFDTNEETYYFPNAYSSVINNVDTQDLPISTFPIHDESFYDDEAFINQLEQNARHLPIPSHSHTNDIILYPSDIAVDHEDDFLDEIEDIR